jgi:hypothetical protein
MTTPMPRRRHAALGTLAGLLLLPSAAAAQIRASEIGSVSQIVDGTKITIEGSRPRARGRDPIFGTKAVRWDEVWTPGANFATTLELSRDAKLNGRAVPKGKYSMWLVVKQAGDWTMVLEPRARLYHMEPPDSSAAQIRFPVRTDSVAFTEVLTWSVPALRVNGATVTMQWERKRVSMDLAVEPSLRVELPLADAQPYLGQYDYDEPGPNGASRRLLFSVTYENGIMKGQWQPNDAYMGRFALIRVGPDTFAPGLYDKDGQIYEVLRPDMIFTFSRSNGRVSGLEARYEDDTLAGKATRKER